MFLSSFPQHKGDSYKTTHQAERLTSGPQSCGLTPAVHRAAVSAEPTPRTSQDQPQETAYSVKKCDLKI